MERRGLESGALLPVLQSATHEDLQNLVDSINQALDVFIKRKDIYHKNKNDLTKIPEFVAEYLCLAGGHTVKNWLRGGGPEYSEILCDVCEKLNVSIGSGSTDVVGMEQALLAALIKKAMSKMTAAEKQDFLDKLRQEAKRPIDAADLGAGGAQFGFLAPLIFQLLVKQLSQKGIIAVAAGVAGGVAVSIISGIGALVGVVWLAHDLAGPSYRGTIPAVVEVALLRQRFLWGSA